MSSDHAITDADRRLMAELLRHPDRTQSDGTVTLDTEAEEPDQQKPDPDEPWRYACPDCESVSIQRLIGGKRPHNETYTFGGRGKQAADADRAKHFRCKVCAERKAVVFDKKRQRNIHSV